MLVPKEVLKNLAMGSKSFRVLRGNGARYGEPHSVVARANTAIEFFAQQMREGGLPADFLIGKRVLELGPGCSLILPLWFLAHGADRADAIDRHMELLPQKELADVHQLAAQEWPSEMRGRVKDLFSWSGSIDDAQRTRLGYLQMAIENAPADRAECFDLIVSYNVLGSIDDVRAAFRALYRLIAPGGYMIHRIHSGTQGIVIGKTPTMTQLMFSPLLWRLMTSNRSSSNQRPMSAHVTECQMAGFTDIRADPIGVLSNEELEMARPYLHKNFRDRSNSDLAVHAFSLMAKKT
jgi:SAM-dependent methyltransferase